MGTPDFAVPALKAIVADTLHEVIAVYTQPPRPKGRGQKVQKSPVHEYADSHNITVYTPKSLKDTEAQDIFKNLNADLAIVAAYGLILPKTVLDAPHYGCINIHASILPRWRGASPIQQAIWHGDAQSGISIMQMDEGLDTGAVILNDTIPITLVTTSSVFHDQLSEMGGRLIIETLERLSVLPADQNRLPATQQNEEFVTYAPLLKKEDGHIDWNESAPQIDRQIRALNPWPGIMTIFNGQKFKILKATPQNVGHTNHLTGTVLNKKGDIACGENTILRIETLQPFGKKAMDFVSAINGHYIAISDKFSKS